jgi:hypothetical protein
MDYAYEKINMPRGFLEPTTAVILILGRNVYVSGELSNSQAFEAVPIKYQKAH